MYRARINGDRCAEVGDVRINIICNCERVKPANLLGSYSLDLAGGIPASRSKGQRGCVLSSLATDRESAEVRTSLCCPT